MPLRNSACLFYVAFFVSVIAAVPICFSNGSHPYEHPCDCIQPPLNENCCYSTQENKDHKLID